MNALQKLETNFQSYNIMKQTALEEFVRSLYGDMWTQDEEIESRVRDLLKLEMIQKIEFAIDSINQVIMSDYDPKTALRHVKNQLTVELNSILIQSI